MKITSVFGPHTPTYPQEHFHHCTDYDGDTSEIEVWKKQQLETTPVDKRQALV